MFLLQTFCETLQLGACNHTGGAVPLRFLVKTAITAVTPPVVFIVFLCDPTDLQLRFDGGATAIIGGITAVLVAALRGQ